MSTRLVCLLLILLAVPVISQSNSPQQTRNRIQSFNKDKEMRREATPELDTKAVQLEAIHHDAADLSTLSTSLQSDLEQLQKGMLAKDLAEKLKKIEKLSKKLRQEMSQ
jgi:hypothetical protein